MFNRSTKRLLKGMARTVACLPIFISPSLNAQKVEPLDESTEKTLVFNETPLSLVLETYADLTGKAIILDPKVSDVQVTFATLEDSDLPAREVLIAIETMLAQREITLEPYREHFILVQPAAEEAGKKESWTTPSEGGAITPSNERLPNDLGQHSQVIELKNMTWEEAAPVVEAIKDPAAKVQPLPRRNAFLITDVAVNINRLRDMLDWYDSPLSYQESVEIRQIKYANASDIATRIEELIADTQEEQSAQGRTASSSRLPVFDSRGRRLLTTQNNAQPPKTIGEVADVGERPIIQGKVQIVADERTNKLIIITRKENMSNFIDPIIEELDKEMSPDITAKTIFLQFAEAEEISALLNDLIGAATAGRDDGTANATADRTGRDTSISDVLRRRATDASAARNSSESGGESEGGGLGSISENTKIIADERTNAILITGKLEDIEVLEGFIRELDIELEQVLIEVAILEVNLVDSIEYGLQWLQRSFTAYNQETRGAAGGLNVAQPVLGFGGTRGSGPFTDGGLVDRTTGLGGDGLNYALTFYDLNLDVLADLAASSSDARLLSIPQIIVRDNSEAKVLIGQQRPVPEASSTTIGGVVRSQYTYRDIGISLDAKVRINPYGMVELELNTSVDGVAGEVNISGDQVPIISRKEFSAEVSVLDRSTVVLGGLVSEDQSDSEAKVPFLGDIPGIGYLFKTTSKSKDRSELLLLVTPTVLKGPKDAIRETRRLYNNSASAESPFERGWSASDLSSLPNEDYIMWKDEVRFAPEKTHVRDPYQGAENRYRETLIEQSKPRVRAVEKPVSSVNYDDTYRSGPKFTPDNSRGFNTNDDTDYDRPVRRGSLNSETGAMRQNADFPVRIREVQPAPVPTDTSIREPIIIRPGRSGTSEPTAYPVRPRDLQPPPIVIEPTQSFPERNIAPKDIIVPTRPIPGNITSSSESDIFNVSKEDLSPEVSEELRKIVEEYENILPTPSSGSREPAIVPSVFPKAPTYNRSSLDDLDELKPVRSSQPRVITPSVPAVQMPAAPAKTIAPTVRRDVPVVPTSPKTRRSNPALPKPKIITPTKAPVKASTQSVAPIQTTPVRSTPKPRAVDVPVVKTSPSAGSTSRKDQASELIEMINKRSSQPPPLKKAGPESKLIMPKSSNSAKPIMLKRLGSIKEVPPLVVGRNPSAKPYQVVQRQAAPEPAKKREVFSSVAPFSSAQPKASATKD